MKKNIFNYVMASSTLLFASCTDLVVKETDSKISTTETGEFTGVEMPASLVNAYNGLNWENSQQDLYALNVGTTDEIFIPTRGTDWGDNGVWRDLAKHAWTSAHVYNYQTWNYLNSNVYKTNQILHAPTVTTAQEKAEAKFIRAYNMFWILDLWQQVPFRDADEGPEIDPKVLTAAEAVAFIEKDLTDAIADLPATGGDQVAAQGKGSKAAARYMLAKLNLNKHVYLGQAAAAAADMDKVISLVDLIAADGYAIEDDFFQIFAPSADSETIFWANGQYAQRIWGSLHYNQGRDTDWAFGGWNGFATTAEFYSKFEGPADDNSPGGGQEERRGYVPNNALGIGFLIGKQYDQNGVIKARSGADLSYSKTVPSLTGQPDYTGIRLLKWHPTINMGGTWNQHLVLMRYSDAHLMKAEAKMRKGDDAGALVMVNQLRALRDADPLADLGTAGSKLLDERGRELYLEGWRRQDLIRFGQFNTKITPYIESTDDFRKLYPIPDNAMGSNPNLKQNPGY
jgi:hypothetical protein